MAAAAVSAVLIVAGVILSTAVGAGISAGVGAGVSAGVGVGVSGVAPVDSPYGVVGVVYSVFVAGASCCTGVSGVDGVAVSGVEGVAVSGVEGAAVSGVEGTAAKQSADYQGQPLQALKLVSELSCFHNAKCCAVA